MRYPVVTLSAAQAYVLGRREQNIAPSDPPTVTYRGEGDDCVDELEVMASTVERAWKKRALSAQSGYAKDGVEGELSVLVYQGLQDLPAEVLTDRDFWRYLATAHFFDYTEWRDGADCTLRSYGCDRDNPGWDCVPLRMFNRALISVEGHQDGDPEDPFWGARVAGTDLWRSHILRVLNGNAPAFVRGMLVEVKEERLKTDVLREFALGARRMRANVLFELLDAEQAKLLIEGEEARARAALDRQKIPE